MLLELNNRNKNLFLRIVRERAFLQNIEIYHCFLLNYIHFHIFNILQPLKSGTTAVCSLIRGNTLYSAWLGDSQAVLVRNGYPVKVVEPHKPNRPVSNAFAKPNKNLKLIINITKTAIHFNILQKYDVIYLPFYLLPLKLIRYILYETS